jgi:hypothetical protein
MVLTKEINRASRRNSGASYEVNYRFMTGDGRQIEGWDEVDVHAWEALVERGPVTVEFLPGDPGTNRVAGNNDWVFPLVFGGLGLLFSVGGGLTAGVGVRSVLRQARLRQGGVPAVAVVTAVEPTNVRVNGRPRWAIRYRYADPLGQERTGRSGHLTYEEANAWRPGDAGYIRYDARRPKQSVWVGEEWGGRPER